MGLEHEAKDAARTAESSTVFEIFARAGFAAVGVIHLLVGVLAIALACGAHADSSPSGALKAVAGTPVGSVLLWILALVLWVLAVWEGFDGLLGRGTSESKAARRVSDWARGLGYLVLGVVAASIALGSRPNADRSAVDISRGLLAVPGGVFVLGAVGIGIAVAGAVFAVIGVRRGFRKKMTLPPGLAGRAIEALGLIGYAAKGLALLVVGILVLVAAVRVDPQAAGGVDAAMSALMALPFGPLLTALVGAGFVLYGAFCLLRTRYAKL
ncbi:DUF1206 domain-containing protein [Microbacterium luticocti]|uniref:DUF1206 domain-containing protein n=1 Tax=Microbacterium luticocti TaxID=451764 RepID=UPI0003FEE431|nr:DUF1206 domain-containing protein [Microbacterium luticocti]